MSDATNPETEWPGTIVPETRATSQASLWQTVAPEGTSAPSIHLQGESTEATESSKVNTGRYQILGEIARGGMGAVLRGRDAELNRVLATRMIIGSIMI